MQGNLLQGASYLVRQQGRDRISDMLLGSLHVPVNEDFPQACVDEVLDEMAVIAPYRLDTLAVHLQQVLSVRGMRWIGLLSKQVQ